MTLTWNGDDVKAEIRDRSLRNVFKASEYMREKLLETLSGNRSGRRYRVPGTSVFYTASAPGEPPAVRLGGLRRSIQSEVVQEQGEYVGLVGTDLDYGLFLENGTSKMLPRPWLVPTFEREQENIQAILREEWDGLSSRG